MTALLLDAVTVVCPTRRLYVAPSRHGLGFFTALAIPAGDVFYTARGEIGSERTRHTAQLDAERHLDAPNLRWVNHGCEPNARLMVPVDAVAVHLAALRNIAAGEEILLDYASFEDHIAFCSTCTCGSARCRGTIAGFLDLSEFERARVGEYAVPWLRAAARS